MTSTCDDPKPKSLLEATTEAAIDSFTPDERERFEKSGGVGHAPSPPDFGRDAAARPSRDSWPTQEVRVKRATAWLHKTPGAISKKGGHNHTLTVARTVVRGFVIDREAAHALIMREWNDKCEPDRWTDAEMWHKIDEASTAPGFNKPVGWMYEDDTAGRDSPLLDGPASEWAAKYGGGTSGTPASPPPPSVGQPDRPRQYTYPGEVDNPHRLAREFLDLPENVTLRCYRDEFLMWAEGAYRAVAVAGVKSAVTAHTHLTFHADHAGKVKAHADGKSEGNPPTLKPVTKPVKENVIDTLRDLRYVPAEIESPAWIDGATGPDPRNLIACRNGLYCLATGQLLPHSTSYLNFSAAPFDYDPHAAEPTTWLRFLADIWPDDPDSIACLQEWFGYLLTTGTRQQKILMIVGPQRAGKGTIGRVLKALVGERNFAGPTLNGLTTEFGLAPLVGKSVALIDDAQLSGRADSVVIAERLKCISGEGTLTIDRKHMTSINAKLSTRFVILSNELPRIADTSGALAGRVILLQLTRTFFGKEDTTLTDRITASELPGVLLWAIDGLRRLTARNRFVQPGDGRELLAEMNDLGSPVGAFVRERCVIGAGEEVNTKDLFTAWQAWCEQNGRKEPGTAQSLSRDVRAVVPSLQTKKVKRSGEQGRVYVGLRLKNSSDDAPDGLEPLQTSSAGSSVPRNFPLHTREGERRE